MNSEKTQFIETHIEVIHGMFFKIKKIRSA